MSTPAVPSAESAILDKVQSAWGLELQPAGCRTCRQAFLIDPAQLGQPCPNCAQGVLESQPVRLRTEPPELLLPFQRQVSSLVPAVEKFVKEVWLRPADFTASNLLKRARPLWQPMWLVDSSLNGTWQAESGFDYQVKSSQDYYSGSSWQSREVIETRVRWEPRLGQIQRRYHNIAAPATSDHAAREKILGSYSLEQTRVYDAALLGSGLIRVPDEPPESAWPAARAALDDKAGQECCQASGAQHTRSLKLQVEYQYPHWTLLLLPMYTSYYLDDEGCRRPVWIHGQSGQINGVRVASQSAGWKWAAILGGIGLVLLILSLILGAAGVVFPPLAPIAILLAVVAFLFGIAAIIPAVWPWQWNQRHKSTS